jgi:hypothetical protein
MDPSLLRSTLDTVIKKDDRFQYGDLIATRSNSLLSRAIRWFMTRQKKTVDTFSHIAVVIDLWDQTWVAEALAKGVVVQSLKQSGYDTNEQVIILRLRKGFSKSQIEAISLAMVQHAGIRYQFINLVLWAIKIAFKLDLLRKNNEKRIYCSELGAIAINTAYPGTFPAPNKTSPADHYTRKDLYEIIDINNILLSGSNLINKS